MINPQILQRHIDDYVEVFGQRTNSFVCPITLRRCDPSELINGHILNQSLLSASRRTVVQYREVDHFYGTRVEPEFVRYLNMKELSMGDLVRKNKSLTVEFEDGSIASAFSASSSSGKRAGDRFPIIDVPVEGERIPLCVRIEKEDPRLQVGMRLVGLERMIPSHWTAAMLKAAMLAMFAMIGYRMIADPFGDTLRRTLAEYFNDRASAKDAGKYFFDFQNSVKLLGKGKRPEDLRRNYQPIEFDTLERSAVLIHYSGQSDQSIFAASCIFRVNGATVTITIPQSLGRADVAGAWGHYTALLAGRAPGGHRVLPARFKENRWEVVKKPLDVHYLIGKELFEES